MERYNDNPIALSEGKVFVDGVQILDGVKFELKFTPDVYTGKVLGERSPSSRWMGYTITGTITRRISTPWYKEIVQKYQKDGITPECTIQGVMDDKGSDYYQMYGSDTVTAVGCVFTGDIPLMALDTAGAVSYTHLTLPTICSV
mgnify:CR=1 FL=1